jgi:hypothetical protein
VQFYLRFGRDDGYLTPRNEQQTGCSRELGNLSAYVRKATLVSRSPVAELDGHDGISDHGDAGLGCSLLLREALELTH